MVSWVFCFFVFSGVGGGIVLFVFWVAGLLFNYFFLSDTESRIHKVLHQREIVLSKDKSTRFCFTSLLIGSNKSLASRLSKQL